MSGFFWNVRGFNKPKKHSVVKKWVTEKGFSFGALLETRVKEGRSNRIASTVFSDWSMLSNYEYNALGRIWLVWRPDVRITPFFKSDQLITVSVQLDTGEDEFFFSIVYAHNTSTERVELWRDLKAHQDSPIVRNKAWLVVGDFNETLDMEEHSSYQNSPTVTQGMKDFQDVTQYCSLLDLASHGPLFTWCNKRGEGQISKKLDRALFNDHWLGMFRHSYSVFEGGGCSDHLRCRIQLHSEVPRPKRPFKFVNATASLEGFKAAVDQFWRDTEPILLSTSSLFRFSKKLKGLKPVIRVLAKEGLGNLTKKTKEAFATLCDKQTANMANPTQQNMEAENDAYKRWDLVSDLEESFLKQKSKMHWLEKGDKNNKSFHRAATIREVRNSIKEIQCDDGTIISNAEDIKNEAERFFREFLQHKPQDYSGITVEELSDLLPYRCNDIEQTRLTKEVTAEEIRKVLFAMPNEKSPGPDGYTSEFFKAAWEIIGAEFTIAIQSFFTKGFLPKGVNTTILALIPKKLEARYMKDYRPISCCNVIYKVISKIIANRLKETLPDFISLNQSAFVKDRLLIENLLLATELVKDYHKESTSQRCAIKIDISKAFDSVQWTFLLNTLKAMCFPPTFIHWISLCVTTASFSVQVNGELAGFFKSERGLRQGCALSPYLFVISMNVLSKLLDKAALDRKIGFHPKCKNLGLTHLSFADDIMVFTDGSIRSIDSIVAVFDHFATISGLRISMEKSTIYFAGVQDSTRQTVQEQYQLESGELPVRYLGLPLLTKRMGAQDYEPLLAQIRNRINLWTNRFLSMAGRFQLICSVLMSITNFWMSSFRLPGECLKEIDRICSAFLWSGPSLNPRKSKIAWEVVCTPKREGGLGLRPLKEANMVSCLKLVWRLTSQKSSLWVQWVRENLFQNGNFWTVKENTSLGSWMWRKLLKYRDKAKALHRMNVQNGLATSFWYDTWTDMGRLIDLVGTRGCIEMGIRATESVAFAAARRKRTHRVDLYNLFETALENQRHKMTERADVSLWKHSEDSYRPVFNTKRTWNLIRQVHPEVQWHSGIWFQYATPKYAFCTWLATHNRLTTGDRMAAWNSGINPLCIFCNQEIETRDHIFFDCVFSTEVWLLLMKGLLHSSFTTVWGELLQLTTATILDMKSRSLLRYTLQASVHSIWRERNDRRHGKTPMSPTLLVKMIDRHIRNWCMTVSATGHRNYEALLQRWFASRE